MIINLLRCKNCGKIYKIVDEQIDKNIPTNKYFYTDFGDEIFCMGNTIRCLKCDDICSYELITSEDWVVDRFFNTKGV